MSPGAIAFGAYLLIGLLAVTISIARRAPKRLRQLDLSDGTELSAAMLLVIGVLWPIWAIIRISRASAQTQMCETLAPAVTEDDVAASVRSIGQFSPSEAKAVLALLEESSVAPDFSVDTSAPGTNIDGVVYERRTVEIFVPAQDLTRATEIVEQWRREAGGLSRG